MRGGGPDVCLHGSLEEQPEGVSGVEAVIERSPRDGVRGSTDFLWTHKTWKS
jgi:hypothetical protein